MFKSPVLCYQIIAWLKEVERKQRIKRSFKLINYCLTARTAAIGIAAFMKTAQSKNKDLLHYKMCHVSNFGTVQLVYQHTLIYKHVEINEKNVHKNKSCLQPMWIKTEESSSCIHTLSTI